MISITWCNTNNNQPTNQPTKQTNKQKYIQIMMSIGCTYEICAFDGALMIDIIYANNLLDFQE